MTRICPLSRNGLGHHKAQRAAEVARAAKPLDERDVAHGVRDRPERGSMPRIQATDAVMRALGIITRGQPTWLVNDPRIKM